VPRCPNSNLEGTATPERLFALDQTVSRPGATCSASAISALSPAERELFLAQFQSNERFFELLLSLINQSCPIPNVELVWAEAASADQAGFRSVPNSHARQDSWQDRFDLDKTSPRPFFEDLASPVRSHSAEVSVEVPYLRRGKYGLVSIAVPIEAVGRRMATLLTGQVLTTPPTEAHLAQIAKDAAGMDWVDVELRQQAYRKVPVVNHEDLRRAAEMLQVVAGFLANVSAQTIEAAKDQRRKGRELRLARREFAYFALDWCEGESGGISAEEITGMQRRIGFRRSPNRILVVRPEADTGSRKSYPITPLEAVEKLCDQLDEVAATRVERSSICVFLHDTAPGGNSAQKLEARRLAARILHEIRETCDLSARIGVGRVKEDWRGLAESYREACLALAGSGQATAFYQEPSGSVDDLSPRVEDLCRLLRANRLEEAGLAVAALPELVSQKLGARLEDFAFARLFFSFVLESMSLPIQKLGCSSTDLGALCSDAAEEFKRAATFSQLETTWLRSAGELLERAGQLNMGKRQQIVKSACRRIQSAIEQGSGSHELSLSAVAAEFGVSVSHMSRTFKQQTGQTFEQYVITQRIDFAKRLLRDPLHNVSEVAVRSGFSDPSYFARVFRKQVGCSPREYCANPLYSGFHAFRQAGSEKWRRPSRTGVAGTPLSASSDGETRVSADTANTSAA